MFGLQLDAKLKDGVSVFFKDFMISQLLNFPGDVMSFNRRLSSYCAQLL